MPEREQFHYELAVATAITMYNLIELEYQAGLRDLNILLFRLKDLSAYSLTHTEILYQQEGSELLALGMFFGMIDVPHLRGNQRRMQYISQEAYDYHGRAEVIERQVAQRKTRERQTQQLEIERPSPQMQLL